MRRTLLYRCACFGLIILAFFACTNLPEPRNGDDNLQVSGFRIDAVKRAYYETMSLASIQPIGLNDKREKTLKRQVSWDDAYSIKTPSGEKLVVPFTLENEIFVNGGSENRRSYSSLTRLLVSKRGGNFEFETATYLADYLLDSSKVTKEWSGQIIVENALGDYVDAFHVDNGKVTGYGVKNNANNRTNILICYEIEYWSCAYVPLIGYYAPCLYMYSEFNHCYSSTPSATGASAGGYLMVTGAASTGSGGTNNQLVDRYTAISKKFTLFPQEGKNKVNANLNELILSCLGKAFYVGLTSTNTIVEWGIDPNSATPGAYNPNTKTIIFRTTYDINPFGLQEELFHAYQDNFYVGGTAQYLLAGRQNIEFEAKLFRDILTVIIGGLISSQTVGEQYHTEYTSWLIDITDGGTKVPTEYSVLASKYFYFLDKFVQAYPEYRQPGMLTLGNFLPGALLRINSSSSCLKKP